MIAIARRTTEGDFRVGAMEHLPWPDDTFDLVTGFNAFHMAADFTVALREAARVGLTVESVGEVDVPWEAPDEATLARALLTADTYYLAIEHSGEETVAAALVEAAAPFRRLVPLREQLPLRRHEKVLTPVSKLGPRLRRLQRPGERSRR
jgi:hypothetical protein